MAIIIEQQSKCTICNSYLNDLREYILIPPIVSNTKDVLFSFSDGGIHTECIEKSKLKSQLLQQINLYYEHLPLSKLKCVVDGKIIDKPENMLFWGLLTSNEKEDLYNFNYISINLLNLSKWKEANRFILIAEKFIRENKWKGLTEFNLLEFIINKIKENLKY